VDMPELQVVSGVILAGGQSSRMKVNKAFIRFQGRPLIEAVMESLSPLCGELIIVTNTPELYRHLPARLVSDVYPGTGALGGLYSGLRAACHDYTLAVACDMPFLNTQLLRYLIYQAPGYDIVIPRPGNYLEPLHALYHRHCLGPMERVLQAGGLRIVDFFPEVRVRYVEEDEINLLDPEHLSFLNINTPADLERAQAIERRRYPP